MRPHPVGEPELDRRFIIRGKNESKVRALFANPKIRELILAQGELELLGRPNALVCEAGGKVDDLRRLRSLFSLMDETLRQLHQMHSR